MNLLNNVSEFFYKKNNLTVLLISVLVFMAFIIFVLPVVAENSKAATGASVSPDQSFFYTASDLYTMAEVYGEEGRRYYIINRFTFDIIWPLVYGAFLVSALTLLLKRKPEGSFLRKMNLLPVVAVLLDFMENIGASIVMFRFPQKTPVIAEVTPIFTMSKWIAIGMAFLLLFILLGQWCIRLIDVRTKSKSKMFLVVVFSVLFILLIAFFVYVQSYYLAKDIALEALQSDQNVEVISERPYTLFRPAEPKDTALIFYPGGKVDHRAYAPVLRLIAEEGYPVVLVEMPFRLAFFGQNRALGAIELLPESVNFVIGGHSLGGAMASFFADKHTEKVNGLLLWASYSSRDLSDSGLWVGSVYGDRDGLISTEQIKETAKNLPQNTLFYRIIGGNHAGFGAYGPQDGALESTIDAEEQWRQTTTFIIEFFEIVSK